MRSLEKKFIKIETQNPMWSSYVCFAMAIEGTGFRKQTIHRWFNKLVESHDYDRDIKRDILKYLRVLTNLPEDDRI